MGLTAVSQVPTFHARAVAIVAGGGAPVSLSGNSGVSLASALNW
jgi:hypothetical protein